ncbi:undecaprenyldiphospho-muramoylpentapeptide beta-N-acetylglucosaminyltransferase [Candidatus Jidaibacter acanthamoebae]|nr:undecaprenyldiphospho-muramoylpentapeptide beta-N-acetylglucosaminyltransferase [Candidatus Jidaibacter acanthamoeba]
MNNNTIIIATGGTGGHIFPAQALSDKLVKENFNPVLICDNRANKFLYGSFQSVKKFQISSSNLSGGIISKLQGLSLLLINILKVIFIYLKIKPGCVVGFGGYPALPSIVAAIILNIPIIMYEPNAVLGRVNKWFLRYAKVLALFMPNTTKIAEKHKKKVEVVGDLVRDELLKQAEQERIKNKKFTLLIFGGSQGAQVFSEVIPEAVKLLPPLLRKKLLIIQQARPNLVEQTIEAYKKIEVEAVIKPFFENIGELYLKADLVICRSGASTISELINFKLPAILVPFPHATDNHQYYNALYLVENATARLITQDKFKSIVLAEQLEELIESSIKLKKLKTAYDKMKTTNGTQKLFSIVRKHMKK